MVENRWFSGEGLTALLGGLAVSTAGFYTGILPQLATYPFMGPGLENSLADTGLINVSSYYGSMYGIGAVMNTLGPLFSIAAGVAIGAGHGKEGLVGLASGALASGGWSYAAGVASGLATKALFIYSLSTILSTMALGVVFGVPLGWLATKIYKKLKGKKE